MTIQNWARSLTYQAQEVVYPESAEEVCDAVAAHRRVKALGTMHSFSDVADTDGVLISTKHLDRVLSLDRQADPPTVTVEPGITYGRLSEYLHGEGYALSNLASLPHISVAGAVATATHGSGNEIPTLSSAVSALTLALADGSLRRFSRPSDPDIFDGIVVGLGALGVIVNVTLDLVQTFDMNQEIYLDLPLNEACERFEEIFADAYSVSYFVNWTGPRINQVWFKRRVGEGGRIKLQGARPAGVDMHPLEGHPAGNCTPQLGVTGPSHERLPHFQMDYTPSSGEELQTEFFLARSDAPAVLEKIYAMRDAIAPHLHSSEVRTVAGDSLWMSPAYGRDTATLQFTWKKHPADVMRLIPDIERALEPYDARPHWAKLFTMPPAKLRSLYPHLAEFQNLVESLDPNRKFANAFLERYVLPHVRI